MAQSDIYRVLKKYKGQKLSASQIATLVGQPTGKALVQRHLRKLRNFKIIKFIEVEPNLFYYYL
jgi:hypothetical protein